MRTERVRRKEGGVEYEYEQLVYEKSDLPKIEAEVWTKDQREEWLIAVLRKQTDVERTNRINRALAVGEDSPKNYDLAQRMTLMKALIREFCTLADYDLELEIVGPKLMDSLFSRGFEKLRDNCRAKYQATQIELKACLRSFTGDEISYQEERRLRKQLAGLEKQGRFFAAAFEVCLDTRPQIIAASGINWGSYLTLKEMASQRNGKIRLREQKEAHARIETIAEGMSDEEFRAWMRSREPYTPKLNGIDAQGDALPGDAAGDNHVVQLHAAE